MVRVHIFIIGDVIGVGFRYWVFQKAKEFGLTGWVRNVLIEKRGVEAVFEGDKEKVEKMIALCKKGPLISWVKNVEIQKEEISEKFSSFEIVKS